MPRFFEELTSCVQVYISQCQLARQGNRPTKRKRMRRQKASQAAADVGVHMSVNLPLKMTIVCDSIVDPVDINEKTKHLNDERRRFIFFVESVDPGRVEAHNNEFGPRKIACAFQTLFCTRGFLRAMLSAVHNDGEALVLWDLSRCSNLIFNAGQVFSMMKGMVNPTGRWGARLDEFAAAENINVEKVKNARIVWSKKCLRRL